MKDFSIRVLIGVAIATLISLLVYFITAFVIYDFNIANWNVPERGIVGLFGIFMGVFIGVGVACNIEVKKS